MSGGAAAGGRAAAAAVAMTSCGDDEPASTSTKSVARTATFWLIAANWFGGWPTLTAPHSTALDRPRSMTNCSV